MAFPWPVSFLRPFQEGGPPVTGWALRVLGAGALLALSLGLAGVLVGLSLRSGGSLWFGFPGTVPLILGAIVLSAGLLLSFGVHFAYVPWQQKRPTADRNIQMLAWTLVAFGVAQTITYLRADGAGGVLADGGLVLMLAGLVAGAVLLLSKASLPEAPT